MLVEANSNEESMLKFHTSALMKPGPREEEMETDELTVMECERTGVRCDYIHV